MKGFTQSLAAVVIGAAVSSAAPAGPSVTYTFSGTVAQSVSDSITWRIQANGGALWMDGSTSVTGCPDPDAPECALMSGSPRAMFNCTSSNPGNMIMNSIFHGGQQVYSNADGTLSYQTSTNMAIPSGASSIGFVFEPPGPDDPKHGKLHNGAVGVPWWYCPGPGGLGGRVSRLQGPQCSSFTWIANMASGYGAWMYN